MAELDAIAALRHASASLPGIGPVDMPGPGELRRRLDDGLADGWLLTVAAAGQGFHGFVAIRPTGAELAHDVHPRTREPVVHYGWNIG